MKRGIVLCIALLSVMIGFAQQKQKDPQKKANHQSEKMKTMLSLDDVQYAAVKKINEEYAVRFLAFRRAEKPVDNRAALKELREEKHKEIAAVLTPEQETKWKTFREERKASKKARITEVHGKRKNELKVALDLTDEQLADLEAERETFTKNKNAIKNEAGLPDADRKQKIKALKSEHNTAVKAILSPEQYEKFRSIKREQKNSKHRENKN